MSDEVRKGHIDFGEQNGKKLVAIHRHEDGTMDLETEDGTVYINCVIKSYSAPKGEGVIVQENVPFEVGEVRDVFSDIMQKKTLDSVD